MKTNLIMTILIVALLVLSAVQAFQINTIKSGSDGGIVKSSSSEDSYPSQVQQTTRYTPTSSPQMVGGC